MESAGSLGFAPTKILCAVDLTPMTAEVLQWARLLAERFGSRIEVVYANYAEYPPYFLPSQEGELAAETEKRRAELRRRLLEFVGKEGESASIGIAILEGHPAEAIINRARATNPDLVVIGSHGHSGFSRLRFGSVAEHLIRTIRIPTFVARTRGSAQAAKISRVLCPVSLDEMAHRSLHAAAAVSRSFGAQLTVVHVAEQGHLDLEAKHRELCQWVPEDVRKRCSMVETVRRGNPAEQILLAAREQSADLIVLSAEGRPFLDLAILGVTAERVLRHAESAVLVIPS